ncbi:hypothetical protein GLW05_20950 [Pontibacillus yanchengensis]|uniref:Helix-turn-helix domain-containing protein n=1 Tax=Pontibacillus yanchengensis TaxID=462910 RepID=A0A6I5A6U4_9BACI|nr:hypothetical protein [Pontibacillus yanchengensis]MYL36043.1 hypothetical protein [Pontibacillus yanchengensis]
MKQVQAEVERLINVEGLKAKDVARVLGIYKQDVSNIRKGKRNLRKKTIEEYMFRLENWKDYLDVSVVDKKEQSLENYLEELVNKKVSSFLKKES